MSNAKRSSKSPPKCNLISSRFKNFFEPLQGRKMAAGMVARRDGDVGQRFGRAYERLRRRQKYRKAIRSKLAPHLTVAGGGRHVNRPMASRAQVAAAAILNRFECAALNIRRELSRRSSRPRTM